MLRDLITSITEADPNVRSVCDPFLGSVSVLTESMLHGLDFSGTDVNPLALLIAKVKSGPFLPRVMEKRAEEIRRVIKSQRSSAVESDFSGISKWFTPRAIRELSILRRAIRTERKLWCRRFLWACLAETVRLSATHVLPRSNSTFAISKIWLPVSQCRQSKCST